MTVFFDLETTGVDKSTDRIVEFSFVTYDSSEIVDTFTRKVNPGMPIPKEASDVHGITNEMVEKCHPFSYYAEKIMQIISGRVLAGYNILGFDLPVLYNELFRAGIVWDYSNNQFLDVFNIYRQLNPRTLSAAYKQYVGEELESAHSAEADVIATAEVMRRMAQGIQQPFDEIIKMSNNNKEIVDLSGCLYKKEDSVYFAFGKHKDRQVKDHADYANWMLTANFSNDTKACLRKELFGV